MLKKISRSIIFSAFAILFTAWWNKGFIIPQKFDSIFEIILITAIGYYLIIPVVKIVLLPVNFLTFGFVSSFVYVLFFYILNTQLHIVTIEPWTYNGFHTTLLTMPPVYIPYVQNLLLSAISISFIISTSETLV